MFKNFDLSKQSPLCLSLVCASLLLSGCEHFAKPVPKHKEQAMRVKPDKNSAGKQYETQKIVQKKWFATELIEDKPTPKHKVKIIPQAPAQTTLKPTLKVAPKKIMPKNAWEDISTAPGLTIALNQRILEQKTWYLQHPGFLSKVLARAEPFLAYVIHEADKRKLPRALALLPIVESRYDPHAISKAGAVGTWQFMPATAKHFGIKMNWWFDGRRDVITSTDAALTYLSQLNQRFNGDWLLALASYNAGGGNVNKAITRNKSLNKATDYWSLRLPDETTKYVPRLLALMSIIEETDTNGVVLPHISSKPAVTAVHTGGQVNIAQIAGFAGMNELKFRSLNPGFRRWASDPQGPHMVLVPSHSSQKFKLAIHQLPQDRQITWQKHKVKPGDTISQIAQTYNMPTREFKRMNQLSSSFIKVGQSLIVPDTSTSLSNKASLSSRKSQIITAGQSITQMATRAKQLTSIDHKIQQGDTLWDISRQYNTSIRNIAAENNIPTRAPLKVGQVLTIQRADDTSSQRVNYQVRAGDSLYGIAKRFKVSIGEIATWNTLNKKNHIKPGQKLTLYLRDES